MSVSDRVFMMPFGVVWFFLFYFILFSSIRLIVEHKHCLIFGGYFRFCGFFPSVEWTYGITASIDCLVLTRIKKCSPTDNKLVFFWLYLCTILFCFLPYYINPFTPMLAASSLGKRPTKMPNLKPLRLVCPLRVSTWKDFCQNAQYWKWIFYRAVKYTVWMRACVHFWAQTFYMLGQCSSQELEQTRTSNAENSNVRMEALEKASTAVAPDPSTEGAGSDTSGPFSSSTSVPPTSCSWSSSAVSKRTLFLNLNRMVSKTSL